MRTHGFGRFPFLLLAVLAVAGCPTETRHSLRVVVLDPSAVPDVAVTATEVATGRFFVDCTDESGETAFLVPAGDYLVHARNLSICDAESLTVWPSRDERRVFDTGGTEDADRVGVLYQVGTGASITLNAGNYKEAVLEPLRLAASGASEIALRMEAPGAMHSCVLLDEQGGLFEPAGTEHVYHVMTWEDESGLPPVPPDLEDLPRGIGNAVATLREGERSDACDVSGLAAGDYVVETNVVLVGGEARVYRQAFTITEDQAAAGATIETTLAPQPPVTEANYLFDDVGDAQGPADVGGLVTSGWLEEDGRTTDEFVVAAGFTGSVQGGPLLIALELRYTDPQTRRLVELRSAARCEAQGARLLCRSDDGPGSPFAVTGTGLSGADGATGTVVWTIPLAGVESVEFRVSTETDAAPDTGFESATRPDGENGNSFVILG